MITIFPVRLRTQSPKIIRLSYLYAYIIILIYYLLLYYNKLYSSMILDFTIAIIARDDIDIYVYYCLVSINV